MAAGPSIAVVGGTGQQGSGLARRLARAGARIVVGSRDPVRARAATDTWKIPDRIDVLGYGEAIGRADITILAIPFSSATATLIEHRDRFRVGSLVVDVMVPLTFVDGRAA